MPLCTAADGELYTCGANDSGQLGVKGGGGGAAAGGSSSTEGTAPPVRVDALDVYKVVHAAYGEGHALAVTDGVSEMNDCHTVMCLLQVISLVALMVMARIYLFCKQGVGRLMAPCLGQWRLCAWLSSSSALALNFVAIGTTVMHLNGVIYLRHHQTCSHVIVFTACCAKDISW